MFGSPGSLTMYSTAPRGGPQWTNNTSRCLSPASYTVKLPACRPCVRESVAPFSTTEMRKGLVPNGYPSPMDYYPYKRPRYEIGCPIMRGRYRFQPSRYNTCSPGPCFKPRDPWSALIEECQSRAAMKPRVNYYKAPISDTPSIFHPLEIKSFVTGPGGLVCTLRNSEWKAKIPGPIYDTYNMQTRGSPCPKATDFSRGKGRPPLFRIERGFGPADFTIPRDLNQNGGIFLSKSDDPEWSTYRLFDFLVCKATKTIYPSPLHYYVRGDFDRMSPKAVSAPFKSTVPRLGHEPRFKSPSPLEYFKFALRPEDLYPPIYPRYPNYFTSPPEPPPFECTQVRFHNPTLADQCFLPGPADYDIPSFTDLLWCACKCSVPAICNPKLGFLTSAEARPKVKVISMSTSEGDEARCWRNIRPKKAPTYPYHGPPPRYPDSPGPIYDTNPPAKACKARRDWWDPRRVLDVGFNTSGCTRKIDLSFSDKNIPGPGLYYAQKPGKCNGGNIKTTGKRVASSVSVGPGPVHKLHEKVASATWRGTHLGTFNIFLKGIDIQKPNAGGYRPHGPLDSLGDIAAGVDRSDDYADMLCPVIKRLV